MARRSLPRDVAGISAAVVLSPAEIVHDLDAGILRVGDGVTAGGGLVLTPWTFGFVTRNAMIGALALVAAVVGNGQTVSAAGLGYTKSAGATVIPDMPGWVPASPVYIEHFGADPSSTIIDDSDALEAAYLSRYPLFYSAGTYVQTRTVDAYHPLTAKSDGDSRAVLLYRDLDGDDAINLLHTGATRGKETVIEGVDVVLEGSDGGTWLKTPEGADARALLPKYSFKSVRWHDPVNALSTYSWEWAVELGEGDHHSFERCENYSSYNPALAPDEDNIRSGFVRLGGTSGGGMGYPTFDGCRVVNTGRVVTFEGYVARPKFDKLEVHNCWDGVVSELASGDAYPAEATFVDCDINTQHRSVDFEYISQLVWIGSDTTRAPGMYDHDLGWTGLRTGYVGNLIISGGRALDPNTGTAYTTVQKGLMISGNNVDISGFVVRASSSGKFDIALDVGYVSRGKISAVVDGAIPVGVNLDTATANPSIKLEGMSYSVGVVSKVVRGGTYNSANSPEFSLVRQGDASSVGYTAAASVNVDVRTSSFKRVTASGGAGPFTVDFTALLDGTERSDSLWFNISMTGANPTVVIKDNTGATQLTIGPPGAATTKKYAVHMRLVGAGNGVWRVVSATETLV